MIGTAGIITTLIGYAIALSHVVLIGVLLLYILNRAGFDALRKKIAPHALLLGALLGWGAIIASLYYSYIVGLPVCDLCWWQRIAIYPIAIIFTIAWWRRETRILPYILSLATLGISVALYHEWLQVGGASLVPCAADGSSDCAKVYLREMGYITFPVIVITILAYQTFFAWVACLRGGRA